jgi:hypothetical protein
MRPKWSSWVRAENSSMKRKRRHEKPEVVGFLGVGLDGDGHRRLTTVEHFVLVGGSADTHERMQDTAIKFNESLERRGKQLKETEPSEIADLLREAHD